MAKTIHVYSTLSAGVAYSRYRQDAAGGPNVIIGSILINGGAGIANKHLVTPRGVHTAITEEELAILINDPIFKKHMEKGFITYSESEGKAETVAADMTTRDNSAPISPNDYIEGDGKAKPEEKPKAKPKAKKK